ncbi:MAG: thiamine pyrophosphate-binding protein [Oscillospiraceae bacterium]|jgi:acetolactate synthase-1/2/3 large subunit|nr:thiamine pyrophosphate-binding protein [Oscillospiraceae bacterium]
MLYTGAEVLIETLLERGTDTVFGAPCAAVADALSRSRGRITHVQTVSRRAAVFAADGYARMTNEPGVCFSKGSVYDLVPGIAAAYADSSPLVCIAESGEDSEYSDILLPIVKKRVNIQGSDDLQKAMRNALAHAAADRPLPVFVSVSPESLDKTVNAESPPESIRTENAHFRAETAKGMIAASKTPLILAGGGARGLVTGKRLAEFAELLGAPVACSLMGVSVFPTSHPLYYGLLDDEITMRSDLIVAVGTRFAPRLRQSVGRLPPVLHINVDFGGINILPRDTYIKGDAKNVLDMLLNSVEQKHNPEWREYLESRRAALSRREMQPQDKLMWFTAQMTGPEAIICTDTGSLMTTAADYLSFEKNGRFIVNGGTGAADFGLAAAIGAQCACPEKTVAYITEKEYFLGSAPELQTVARYHLPIIVIVVNAGATPDIGALAAAHGIQSAGAFYREGYLGKLRAMLATRKAGVLTTNMSAFVD